MFKHAEQAIRFAFRMREKSVITRPSIVPSAREKNSTDRLTAHDFHAQAGMVFSFLNRQPGPAVAFVFLQHGTPQERDAAAEYISLMDGIKLPKHVKNRSELKKALLAKTVRQCAQDLGITNYKAWRTKQACYGIVEPIALRLYEELEDWFKIVH
jgi:hypothetical protein